MEDPERQKMEDAPEVHYQGTTYYQMDRSFARLFELAYWKSTILFSYIIQDEPKKGGSLI